MKDTSFSIKKTLNIKGKLRIIDGIQVMGIINVTPDSFYAGSRYQIEKVLLARVEEMLDEGADFIDIGGYSSRPGAEEISVEEEMARVIPPIKLILGHFPNTLISIDTFRSQVAKQAVDHGAVLINDISGGQLDQHMFDVVAALKVPYIMMHMRGNPQNMQSMTHYDNLFGEMAVYFNRKSN